jgi:hypothetical protein
MQCPFCKRKAKKYVCPCLAQSKTAADREKIARQRFVGHRIKSLTKGG